LEHEKKLHIELKFIGPQENRDKAVKALKALGFTDVSDFIPWREVFSDLTEDELPGLTLKGARIKENITQKQLSEMTGIPQSHISAMENGKRAIGKQRAKLFAKTLNVDYRVFL
jgi:predicted transcriptional regulator